MTGGNSAAKKCTRHHTTLWNLAVLMQNHSRRTAVEVKGRGARCGEPPDRSVADSRQLSESHSFMPVRQDMVNILLVWKRFVLL